MKTTLFTLLVCCLILTFSCNSSHDHDHDHEEETVDAINTQDTISLKKFNKWKKAWERNGEAYMDTATLFQYFTMPIVDLRNVLAEGAEGTKFYFGLEEEKKDQFMLKFMLVGTDKDNNDLIDYAGNNYVYDFTRLCPPLCPN